jgi:hypothetical protein
MRTLYLMTRGMPTADWSRVIGLARVKASARNVSKSALGDAKRILRWARYALGWAACAVSRTCYARQAATGRRAMVQTAPRARWGGTASLWGGLMGGLMGLALALIVLGARLLTGGSRIRAALTGAQAGPLWLRLAVLLVGLIGFFLASFFAARSTRRIEAGIVAGLLAGALCGAAVALTTLLSAVGASRHLAGGAGGRLPRLVLGSGIARGLLDLVVLALVATGIGALAGLLGRGRMSRASEAPYGSPPVYPSAQGAWWPPAPSTPAPEDSTPTTQASRVVLLSPTGGDPDTPPSFP